MADIVISEFMDQTAVDDLARTHDVDYGPDLADRPDELRKRLAPARGLIVRNRTPVRGEMLAAAPHLKVVGRLGVGLDNIDVDACRARGIAVYPAAHSNDRAVSEYVIAVMLVLLRGAYLASDRIAAGTWPRQALIGREAADRRLGLIGYGGIAREVAARARALGMTIAAHDPLLAAEDPAWRGVERMELPDLLAECDVVSLHVPLTEATRGLIGADAIARMRAGAILINTARGGVVDEAALVAALKRGRLGGAALDVFAAEPVGPAQGVLFQGVPNLILTPHIAGVTEESNVRVSTVTVENVRRHLTEAP